MTRFRTIAEKIKERIESRVTELAGRVIVFRKASIDAEFEKKMAMTKGRCVIVRLLDARNANTGRKTSAYVARYTVSLFTIPALTAKDLKDADTLMSEIEAALQGWWPEDVSSTTTWFIDCRGVNYPENFKLKDGTTDCDAAILTLSAPGNLK